MPSARSTGGDEASGALTYQVYAPDALPGHRSMASMTSLPDITPKPSVALRVCLVLLGVCVVVGTAALVIAGASDDSPHGSKAATSASASAAVTSPAANASSSAALAAVTPPALEPPPVVAAAPPPAQPDPPAPVKKGTKPKGAGSALRGVALPPNPFGGNAGTKPAPKKK